MISRRAAMMLLFATTAIVAVVALLLPPIPQPQSYHRFADQRGFLGFPNIGDVVSNLAFAVIGLWGLVFLLRSNSEQIPKHFLDRRERWPFLFVFAGMLLTALGSSYYHLHPDNASLVWDRLPMTIVFMSLVAAVIAERISLRAGLWLLPILLLIGLSSVLQWYWSEVRGAGDLRFYAAVQVYSILVLLIALVFSPALHARIGPGGGGGFLCPRESPGDSRQADFRDRAHRQRPHLKASGGRSRRLLDFAHVAEETATPEPVCRLFRSLTVIGERHASFKVPL